MRATIYFIATLFLLYCINAQSCKYIDNIQLSWNLNATSIDLNVTTFETTLFEFSPKWIAIGFNQHDTLHDGAEIYMLHNQSIYLYKGIENSVPILLSNVGKSSILRIQRPLTGELFNFTNSLQTVILAYNTEQAPSSPTQFEKHTHAFVRKINFFDLGNDCNHINFLWVGRYHLSIPIICIIIILVLFVMLVIFRYHQPLKSRGPIPFLVLPYMLAYQIYSILVTELIPMETRVKYNCWHRFYIHSTSEMFFLVVVVHVLRFIIIINLNSIKAVHLQDENRKFAIYRVLKIITSPWVMVCIAIGWFLIWILYYLIVFDIGNFHCKIIYPMITGNTISIITMSCYAVILIGGIIFDIISNYRLKCNPIEYFFRKDPYLFRFEIYFFMFCAFLFIIAAAIRYPHPANLIHDSILLVAFTFTITVFPLSITIYRIVKNKMRGTNQSKETTVESLFKDVEVKKLFIEFSKNEWSLENIMLWQDIKNIQKKNCDMKERVKEVRKIYETYLTGSRALHEVNIDRKRCEKVRKAILGNSIGDDILNEILVAVEENLMDTYSRFKFSQNYIEYCRAREKQDELAKSAGIAV